MVLTEPRGPWSAFYEGQYQQARAEFARFITLSPEEQRDLSETRGQEVSAMVKLFDALRMGRLMAYLRHRAPDDNVGHSILIYHLDDSEVQEALDGPPTEMVPAMGPLQ
jgi:hypothetical protein